MCVGQIDTIFLLEHITQRQKKKINIIFYRRLQQYKINVCFYNDRTKLL